MDDLQYDELGMPYIAAPELAVAGEWVWMVWCGYLMPWQVRVANVYKNGSVRLIREDDNGSALSEFKVPPTHIVRLPKHGA
jgi:hypothetical protein